MKNASNIAKGGTVTNIVEILRAIKPCCDGDLSN